MHNQERDSQTEGHEANPEETRILDGARRIRKLKPSAFAMSPHCVPVQKSMVSKIEEGAVHRQDSQRDRRSIHGRGYACDVVSGRAREVVLTGDPIGRYGQLERQLKGAKWPLLLPLVSSQFRPKACRWLAVAFARARREFAGCIVFSM